MSQAAALPAAPDRFLSLDVIRGVAVMGILLANIAAFALPEPAYFSPLAWGGTSPADVGVWLANFVFVEGKMRGLFSFLFGASMLLVIDRAEASNGNSARVHFSRMAVLFAIGCAHLYLVWWGDILAHYALAGCIAYFFARLEAGELLVCGLIGLVLTFMYNGMGLLELMDSAGGRDPALWESFAAAFGLPSGDGVRTEIAAMRGSWTGQIAWRWQHASGPLQFFEAVGIETLSAMLLGMAAYRAGFLTGEWSRERYRWWAKIGLGAALSAYLFLGVLTISEGFDQRFVYFGSIVASVPFRILGVIGYSALFILVAQPGGWLTERLAAVGRAAFTNYLATSVLVTGIFYGWGLAQFGGWSRATIYLLPPLVWLLMLAWSKPWLERFRYGPLEWLWRSIARWEWQPTRRLRAAA